ncbi:MAG: nucleoside-diphosphate kinase [Verrucomicrobiales bacterium]|jgi:nucleoside-diphosphate kinase|nr:nucleoside-diphosphate kinase [Verrucomicrobiales bacterium]
MEKTLILLKPDCIKLNHCGAVIQRLELAGGKIRAARMLTLSDALLREHYAHVAQLPFFPNIQRFMQETPVIALVLAGDQIIRKVRDLLGPTDSTQAPKGTIRGDFGTDKMRNVVHASDSPASATLEIRRFFADGEVFAF